MFLCIIKECLRYTEGKLPCFFALSKSVSATLRETSMFLCIIKECLRYTERKLPCVFVLSKSVSVTLRENFHVSLSYQRVFPLH
jgi:hypothetical protein